VLSVQRYIILNVIFPEKRVVLIYAIRALVSSVKIMLAVQYMHDYSCVARKMHNAALSKDYRKSNKRRVSIKRLGVFVTNVHPNSALSSLLNSSQLLTQAGTPTKRRGYLPIVRINAGGGRLLEDLRYTRDRGNRVCHIRSTYVTSSQIRPLLL